MNQSLELAKWLMAALVTLVALAILLLKTDLLNAKEIDAITKVISSFGLVAAGIWALVTYYHNKRQEFQKSFNDRQLDTILLVANTVGDLILSVCSDDWNKTVARFWELYWGRLVLFEDQEILKNMVKLGEKLEQTSYERRAELAKEVYDVSLQLRTFLETKNQKEWRISFDALDKQSKANIALKFGSTSKNQRQGEIKK